MIDRDRARLLQTALRAYHELLKLVSDLASDGHYQPIIEDDACEGPAYPDHKCRAEFDHALSQYRDAANAVALYDYRKAYAETVNEVTGADLNDIPNPHDSINEAAAKFKELFDV